MLSSPAINLAAANRPATIDDNHVIQQRAQIVLDAIEVMKTRPDIDPDRIGLAGVSQAGYVMPRALSLSDDIAFMVCISCPGNPGVDQTTYQIMKSAICEGVPEEKTAQLQALLTELDQARSYQTYAEYVHYRDVISSLLGIAPHTPQGNGFEVIPEEAWLANDPGVEHWWNPVQRRTASYQSQFWPSLVTRTPDRPHPGGNRLQAGTGESWQPVFESSPRARC